MWLLFALSCLGLTYLLYGAALTLPFFFDDFVHYPFVEANSLARIWLTTDELAYYRPLNFSLWRLTYDLFQRHNPLVDHAINLLLHALNGLLVGWLAGRLWALRGERFPTGKVQAAEKDWWRIALSAALFLFFPFSYQAVPWVGSLSHILVTTLILLGLACYVQLRLSGRLLWAAASLLFAALAPFAHENGVLLLPFVVLVDLTTPGLQNCWRQAAKTGLLWALPLLLYLPIWFSLPRLDGGGLFSNSFEGILQNAAYFLQGIFYPFNSFGGWLHYDRLVHDMTAVLLLSGLGLVVALLIQLTNKATLRSLYPWFWVILAALPAVLFLVFDYVINGPRLLMVAGVGIAWLWSDVLLLLARGSARGSIARTMRVSAAGLLTLLLLAQNGSFVRERMTMHTILGDGFEQVVAATSAANEAGQEAIVMNFPSWLAPRKHTYALGHEGVLFWPDYVPPQIFMAVHTGELGDLKFVKVDGIRPELAAYYYGLTGPAADWPALAAVPAQVLSTAYGMDSVALAPVGEVGESWPQHTAPLALFRGADSQESVQLLAAQIERVEGGLDVETIWQSAEAPGPITLFVHLVDSAGNLVAQADGDPLGGGYPFNQWPRASRAADRRHIAVDDPSRLAVYVGLYDRQTGARLQALVNGRPVDGEAVRLD